MRRAGLPTADHGMKRRVEPTTVESTGITSGFAGSGCCSAGMLSSAAVRSGIAAPVVSSRATSRLYSRVTTTRHESVHDRATTQRTAVQSAKGRLLREVISSNECTGAQRIDESGAPSARIPGRGFEVAPTLGPPIKGTAAEDAQSCTSARTIRLLINAVWKIQRDGGATSALARAKDTPPVCRHRSHTGGTGWVTTKHESVPDGAPARRTSSRKAAADSSSSSMY